MLQFLGRKLLRSGFGLSLTERARARAPRLPCCLGGRDEPRLVEHNASLIYGNRIKQLDLMKEKMRLRDARIDAYLKKEMMLKHESIISKKDPEAADDTFFRYCIAISSNRSFLSLKQRCDADEAFAKRLIGFVTRCQRKEANFMLWAMKEHSKYSIPKTYTSESASRAFARTLCPIVIFFVILLAKMAWSKAKDTHKESQREADLKSRFATLRKHLEDMVRDENEKMEVRMTGIEGGIENVREELSKKNS
ncbi:unnamed protein product [Arabidopsis lyrata]|nr:uncharacterized protein LOC9305172 [Arabidopsis lyrata subsp. lyrata]CAH8274267.1 unnamed protein product [Arabidopsis lyrata]|eukprot:XP_002869101.2 uncharacterized protein LOC9305172 [Arabidopsis lyrata subsp. lyrata]